MLTCREVRTDFNCDSCYELTVDNCEIIIIEAGLTAETSYFLQLFDQFDIRKTIAFETDVDGNFEIDQNVLPDNYFNPFGNYDFYVSINEDGSDNVALMLEGEEYSCIILIIE